MVFSERIGEQILLHSLPRLNRAELSENTDGRAGWPFRTVEIDCTCGANRKLSIQPVVADNFAHRFVLHRLMLILCNLHSSECLAFLSGYGCSTMPTAH